MCYQVNSCAVRFYLQTVNDFFLISVLIYYTVNFYFISFANIHASTVNACNACRDGIIISPLYIIMLKIRLVCSVNI